MLAVHCGVTNMGRPLRPRCSAAAAGASRACARDRANGCGATCARRAIISVAKNLDEKELVRLAAWVKKHYSGLDNVSRVMILDNDAKFTPFDMKSVDAEHINLRDHEIESICHGMGCSRSSSAILRRWRCACGRDADRDASRAHDQALAPSRRPSIVNFSRKVGYYIKFIDGEFLRATEKERAEERPQHR
jgi:hypothetical protein